MADYTQPDVVPKRVRFFDGQFLKEQDFIDEQKFHLDRERRQSRLLRFTGIGAGLRVTKSGPFQATVAAGMAVDVRGRHLVLAEDTDLPLGGAFANQQNIEVHLVYWETATDTAQTGGESERRWDESPRIVVRAPDGQQVVVPDETPPAPDIPTVLLARLAVADNGDVTVDSTAAERSTLSVSGAIGVGTTNPGSDLELGEFDARDRHLTFTMAGGNRHRGGIRMWSGQADQGYSIEYDDRAAARPGLHVRTHDRDPAGTTQLFVGRNGDIGIGTAAPANLDGWSKVVDVLGESTTSLSVRTSHIDGGILAHERNAFGAPPGMTVGTRSRHPLSFVTGGTTRLSVDPQGQVGIGSEPTSARLTVSAAENHALLSRPGTETGGGPTLFLELKQGDTSSPVLPPVYPSIRFHHSARFWHRIEARTNGFHIKTGDLGLDDYSDLKAKNLTATDGLTIGSVTVGERELGILKKLADGELKFRLFNLGVDRFIYVGGDFSSFTKYVFAVTNLPVVNQTFQIRSPS